MHSTKKFEPLFEEILIGLLFFFLGKSIVKVYNESFLGLLGLLSIFWGGFKMFVGLFIYIIFFYSLVFKPEYLSSYNQKLQIQRIRQRIINDIDCGRTDKALNRLHFLTQKFPNKDEFKQELANLYIKLNKPVNAGRQLFLVRQKTQIQKNAVEQFKKSNGNNEFQILRRLFNYREVDAEFYRKYKSQLLLLLKNIKNESEKNSWIVKEIHSQINKLDISTYNYWVQKKSTIINIIALIVIIIIRILA